VLSEDKAFPKDHAVVQMVSTTSTGRVCFTQLNTYHLFCDWFSSADYVGVIAAVAAGVQVPTMSQMPLVRGRKFASIANS
jgi:hypothetical protein